MSESALTPLRVEIFNALQEFLYAHCKLQGLVANLIKNLKEPPGWDGFDDLVNILWRNRHEVTTFLVTQGKENPQTARQVVDRLIAECQQAKRQLDSTGLAFLDTAGIQSTLMAAA